MEYLVNSSIAGKLKFSYMTEEMVNSDTDSSLIKLARENKECEMTDFAKFLRSLTHVYSGFYNENWIINPNKVDGLSLMTCGIRPYGFSKDVLNQDLISNSFEYPQDTPSKKEQSMLETLYRMYKSAPPEVQKNGVGYLDSFKKTDKIYVYYNDYKFACTCEYTWKNRKFIRMVYNGFEDGSELSNQTLMRNDYCWFEVLPIKWIIDYEKKEFLSEKILLSGIPFFKQNNSEYETNLEFFLNEFFRRDIIPSKIDNYKTFSISLDERSMIPCSFFKDETFEEINSDFSKITSIGAEAFKNCVNLKHLVFPSVHSIGLDAFNNCPNLTLSFPVSSLINLDCDNKSYAVCSEIFLRTFNVKKLTICGREIPLDETGYRTFSKLQGEEIEGVVSYVLYSLNLKYDYPYFKYDIVEVMQHCDIDLIKKPIYDYIVNHKAFTFMTKKKLKEFINEKIKEYYDVNHTCKDVYNELVKVNNPLFTLEPNEVLQKIPNEKTADIDINIPTTIMDYGSNFDNYFSYVASTFGEAVIKHNNITELVDKLKNTIIEYKKNKKDISKHRLNERVFKYSLSIDDRYKLIEKIFVYTNQANSVLIEEIEYLETLKRIILINIQKLTDLENNLHNYVANDLLVSEIISEKINSFNNIILNLKQEFDQINLYLTIDFINKTRMQFIKNNLLPILNLNKVLISDGLSKDELKVINKAVKLFNKPVDNSAIPKNMLSSLVPPDVDNSLPDALSEPKGKLLIKK